MQRQWTTKQVEVLRTERNVMIAAIKTGRSPRAVYEKAKREGIALRRTYVKEIKGHRITLRFFRHPKKKKKAASAMRRLRTIAKILIRDIDRHLDDKGYKRYFEAFYLFMRVLLQKRASNHKIYSLHESHIYAMAKGKDNTG